MREQYSYSRYWPGTSLQLRLMWGNFSDVNDINLSLMIFPHLSLSYKLVREWDFPRLRGLDTLIKFICLSMYLVPVQYREFDYGLLTMILIFLLWLWSHRSSFANFSTRLQWGVIGYCSGFKLFVNVFSAADIFLRVDSIDNPSMQQWKKKTYAFVHYTSIIRAFQWRFLGKLFFARK